MKKYCILLLMSFVTLSAFATVDAHDRVYLVVEDIQSGEFFVERAPIIGCYGLPQGPRLAQFTMEYKVNSNLGCGGQVYQDNINYLTCGSVISYKESDDFMSFSEIVLDISKCAAKANPQFIRTLRSAARMNFPQTKGRLKLKLIK